MHTISLKDDGRLSSTTDGFVVGHGHAGEILLSKFGLCVCVVSRDINQIKTFENTKVERK